MERSSAVTSAGSLLEHASGRLAMDVGALLEGLPEVDVAGDVGQDAQLDLAVVGRQQHEVIAAGHEGAADAPPQLRADGDVLQVGVGRGEPPGGGDGLLERGVQAPGGRVDEDRQGLDVGGAELGVDAPVEQHGDHGVRRAELLEHLGIGRVAGLGALAARQVQLVEEDLLQLLGAAQVELVADRRVDVLLPAGRWPRGTSRPARTGPPGRGPRRWPPCPPGPAPGAAPARRGCAAAPGRPRGSPMSASCAAPAADASTAACVMASSWPAPGRATSSRSAQMSASDWLRSAALRM